MICAVEGCEAESAGRLRFNDIAEDAKTCKAHHHVGPGLVFRVELCDDHLSLCRGRGADTHRWSSLPDGS